MSWDAIAAIGEVVGAAAVVASLMYVAVQIRGDAQVRRLEAIHTQSEAFNGFFRSIASDIEVGEIYFQGIRDFHSLEGARVPRFSALMGYLFRLFENQFYQRNEGHLDRRVWEGFEAPMDDIIAYPGVKDWWKTRRHWYSQEFQSFIAGKIEKGRPPSMYRELSNLEHG